jgi:hypothetical protein
MRFSSCLYLLSAAASDSLSVHLLVSFTSWFGLSHTLGVSGWGYYIAYGTFVAA